MIQIRDYRDTDLPALQALATEIQDYERRFDPDLRPGATIAGDYAQELLETCRRHSGRILMAEIEGAVGGLVAFRTVKLLELERPHIYISDLVVFERYRRHGVGRALLEAVDADARLRGVDRISLMVYADNRTARDVYVACGFGTHAVEMIKRSSEGRTQKAERRR